MKTYNHLCLHSTFLYTVLLSLKTIAWNVQKLWLSKAKQKKKINSVSWFLTLSFTFSPCLFFLNVRNYILNIYPFRQVRDFNTQNVNIQYLELRSNYLIKITMLLFQSLGGGDSLTLSKNCGFKFIGSKYINFLDQNGEPLKISSCAVGNGFSQSG